MPKQITDREKTDNIYTRVIKASPLISYAIKHGGGECDCVSFLTTSSQTALQEVLSHTHNKPNKNKEVAVKILEEAHEAHRRHFRDTVRSDDDVRTTRHRLQHTRNRVTAQQSVRTPINYIKRSLGDDTLPPTVIMPNTERRFQHILDTLPIEAGKISDTALERLTLMPDSFDSYCGIAKEIFLHTAWKKIAHILGEGKTVYRGKHLGRSSRIMQIKTLSGEIRYVIFTNRDMLHIHTTPSKTSQHKVQRTSFQVFENYEDFMRSQEHAINSLKEKIRDFIEWQVVLQGCRLGDQEDCTTLIREAAEYFGKLDGYYPEKITLCLQRELRKSGFVSHALKNIDFGIKDMQGKLQELQLVYQNLAKGREKIIMEDARAIAHLINQ